MSLTENFDIWASGLRVTLPPPKTSGKRPQPFSLRLSETERAQLIAEAGGAPLGTYVKSKLFGNNVPVRSRRTGLAVADKVALAKALALLGQTRFASNLNQLAHLASIGALAITPDTEAELHSALHAVREARLLLMAALGLKPEGTA